MISIEEMCNMHEVIKLYKKFDRYKDYTHEELFLHILPSFKLSQYKIHKNGDDVIAFTNWAFLNKEAEKRFLQTTELESEDWNSGTEAWHVDTVCIGNIKKVMAWTKKYFKEVLEVGKCLHWLRVDDQGNIYRKASKFKREFHQ